MHASVRDNLLLARPGATEGELWAALAAAQVADLVASLPDGLETVVGARGHRFSGGEQQRLAVARTILRDPPVLVLDEATVGARHRPPSGRCSGRSTSWPAGRTTITIAHRLSTVRDADRIAVLDGGRLVESGTHDELVAARWPVRGPGRGHRAGPRRLTLASTRAGPGQRRPVGRSRPARLPARDGQWSVLDSGKSPPRHPRRGRLPARDGQWSVLDSVKRHQASAVRDAQWSVRASGVGPPGIPAGCRRGMASGRGGPNRGRATGHPPSAGGPQGGPGSPVGRRRSGCVPPSGWPGPHSLGASRGHRLAVRRYAGSHLCRAGSRALQWTT